MILAIIIGPIDTMCYDFGQNYSPPFFMLYLAVISMRNFG
jgi:hypothetical protein